MTNEVILLLVICMAASGFVGYRVGRNESLLLSKIDNLKKNSKPEPEKPTVILGTEYVKPQQVSSSPDERKVGLVESKTPERIEWEANQALEKEALGR